MGLGKSSDKIYTAKIYTALGLMSGTSLDGVDAAIIRTDGENIHAFGPSCFRPYTDVEREILLEATGRAMQWRFGGARPDFSAAEAVLHQAHIEAAREIFTGDVDVIGFHGQTLIHISPQNGRLAQSLQIGDGHRLAEALKRPVVFDFRSADIEAGGQGAPLVPVYHQALVRRAGLERPVAIVNIGGVSNLTYIGADGLWATDCGPGNGPLDDWVAACGLGAYDVDGRLSSAGKPDTARVARWLDKPFFTAPPPKSADRREFDVLADLAGHSPEDGAATLVRFTAMSIIASLQHFDRPPESLIICGGGRKNTTLMQYMFANAPGAPVLPETLGWDGDSMEAQAFAYLAVRRLLELPITYPGTTGVPRPCTGGVVAFMA